MFIMLYQCVHLWSGKKWCRLLGLKPMLNLAHIFLFRKTGRVFPAPLEMKPHCLLQRLLVRKFRNKATDARSEFLASVDGILTVGLQVAKSKNCAH